MRRRKFKVKVSVRDKATRELLRLAEPDSIEMAVRRGAAKVSLMLAGHFRMLNTTQPNRFVREGWGKRRTYFWRRMADSIKPLQYDATTKSATIPMSPIIGHKVHGGPVYPVKAKALTIPVHPEAHGRRAARLELALGVKLFILKTALGDSFLAAKVKRGKTRFNLVRFYLLKKAVFHKPWPNTLPERKRVLAEFKQGIKEAFGLKTRRSKS